MAGKENKPNITQIVSLIIALVLIIGMMACGDSTIKEDNETTKASETTKADETTKVDETTKTTESTKADETTIPEEPTTIANGSGLIMAEDAIVKMMFSDYGRTKFTSETYLIKEFSRQMGNAEIDILTIPLSDYVTKINTLIVSGDLPDIMMLYNSTEMASLYGPKGLFYPIDTKLENMPVLQDIIKRYPDYTKITTTEDGHIYAMPYVPFYDFFTIGMMISPRVKDFGIDPKKDINTMDDLYNVLKIIKENDPESIPFVTRRGWALGGLIHMFGTNNGFYYNAREGKYKYGPTEDNYRLMVEFMNKLYKEELLHKNFRTTFEGPWRELLGTGIGYFTVDNIDQMFAISLDPGDPEEWFIPILSPEVNGIRYYSTYDRGSVSPDEGGWIISAKTEYIDNILSFVEWGYSDEGVEFMTFGKVGETCERMPDGLLKLLIPEGMEYPNLSYNGETMHTLGLGQFAYVFRGLTSGRSNPHSSTDDLGQLRADTYIEALDYYKRNDAIEPTQPMVSFTSEEAATVRRYKAALNTFSSETIIKFIKGDRPISEWDAYVQQAGKMKLDEVLAIHEAAFVRYNAN